nr:hypothetical protein [Tanacetum cinerariifolium]
MAESLSPNITPKEEPVTLDIPKSSNPFLPTIQVLPDSKIWVSTSTKEVRGDIGITTFINALRAQYLSHSSMYVPPPSITTLRAWFATKGYNREIGAKGTLKKSCLPPKEKIVPYPRFISHLLEHMAPKYDNAELIINLTHVFNVHNWILKPNQPEEPPFTDHIKPMCNLDMHVDTKAPKYSSPTEEVLQGKKPRARNGVRRKQSSKHTSESTTEASKSQSDHSKKETKSSLAMDTSPSHPSPPHQCCLPTKLKELPSKIIGLSGEIKELKQHIKDIEIELPGDLKEIPSKLETFTSSISNLSSQEKLKTLDSLPGLLKTVTNTLNSSSIGEPGVKKVDLVSLKISAKSSSFTFREMSSAPDSLFTLEVVWEVFNPSPTDLVLSTRTLGLDPARADILGSALAMKSAEASCPDADSE